MGTREPLDDAEWETVNMKRKTYHYVTTLLLSSTVFCAPGCSTEARGPGETAKHIPQQPLVGQRSFQDNSPTEEGILRCVAEPVEGPGRVSEGCFVDEQHAWVWEGGSPRRTTDGGRSWQRIRPSDEAKRPYKWSEGLYLRVSSITPNRAWLTGDDYTWQTDDGGTTWRRLFPQASSPPYFADTNHGWMIVATSDSSNQSYVTKDGGQTWYPCGPALGDEMQTPAGRAYFLSPQLGWAITSQTVDRQTIYGVARSTDGGCKWKQLWTSDENPDERYSSIYFLNEREGWLAGSANGSLFHTIDGGKTWNEINLPVSNLGVLDVYFAGSQKGWIYTERGIYRTTNAGRTWRLLAKKDVASGFGATDGRSQIPERWKTGRLMQLIYASKQAGQSDQLR